MIRLEVELGEAAGQSLEREAAEITLGRAPTSDLLLPDWHISGAHGVVRLVTGAEGHGLRYRDLRSTNGSRIVRGDQVLPVDSACHFERELRPGDRIMLGDAEHPVLVKVSYPVIAATPDDPFAFPATSPGSAPQVVAVPVPVVPPAPEARVVAMRPVASIAEARQIVEGDPVSLKAVYEATRAIGAPLELDEVLDAVADAIFTLLPRATHLTVVLRDETREAEQGAGTAPRGKDGARDTAPPELDQYVPVTTRVRGATGPQVEPIPVSRSVFRKVVEQRAAVLAADAQRDVARSVSIMGASILSTMAVPLWKGEDILGVLQVDNRASPGIFR
ncbi:MAG: FHA domain-containing protein, partial [Deltaproteobacteria bacterium]